MAVGAFAALALLPACGRHRGHDPARNAGDERQYAEDFARAECVVQIEVFMPGMQPARPYRVLGPVDGSWGWTVESRFNRMKKKACELGASAILDASERYEAVGDTTTRVVAYDRFGRPVVYVEAPRGTVRRTTAIAIAYTDVAVAAPTPAPGMPSPTPAPAVVVVPAPTPTVVYSNPPAW